MSSAPFRSSLKIFDNFKYDPPFEGATISFVLRGKDANDVDRKLKRIIKDVPSDMDMCIYHIGLRPDKPVPVARYFVEVEITKCRDVYFGWSSVWQGKKTQ